MGGNAIAFAVLIRLAIICLPIVDHFAPKQKKLSITNQ
jgi:hypothetical protein